MTPDNPYRRWAADDMALCKPLITGDANSRKELVQVDDVGSNRRSTRGALCY